MAFRSRYSIYSAYVMKQEYIIEIVRILLNSNPEDINFMKSIIKNR